MQRFADQRACRLPVVACLLLLFAAPAFGADILSAAYEARTDEIVARIAYRGSHPHHNFRVEWGACEQGGVAGRLVDEEGSDAALRDYRVTERLGLQELPCRPAVVTLRLGRVAHMSVRVPARDVVVRRAGR